MSASDRHALDAVAFQLVAALEQYELDTRAMIGAWPDLELYQSFSEQVEEIRMYSGELPQLRVQWVELLIAHAELVHVLWREQHGGAAHREQLAAVRERHADCVVALRNRCLRILGGRPRTASSIC